MKADQDLNSQQKHLSATSYDLRISNLARFIYKKIQTSNLKLQTEGYKLQAKSYKLLDVGAGNGLFLKFFKNKGFEVAGYELEQKNVDNMLADPMLKNENIKLGDITKITNPRGAEKYDVVIASDVIEHIKDDKLAIQNLWSFVKPDGLLIITVPAHSYLYGKRDEKWGHFRRYNTQLLLNNIQLAITNDELQMTNNYPVILSEAKNPEMRLDPSVSPQDDDRYEIEFLTQWNIVGFFVYFLFEKILHKPINESMRYSNSTPSKFVRIALDLMLQLENLSGGVSLGLTLVVGVKKNIGHEV